MNGLEFQNPLAFHWLWAALLAAALVWYAHGRRRRAAAAFASGPLFARLAPAARPGRIALASLLSCVALGLMAAALADPRAGEKTEEVRRKGIDVIFVLDVSRSMLAEDVAPNRLGKAKQLVSDAVDRMAGDRAGLVAFAGVPAMKSPLTLNYGAFKIALNELAPQDSARGGSLLGDAIRLAADSFTDDEKGGKAIVVLSDGEDMESYPVEAARKAFVDKGIRTYTIGIGDSAEGARIPITNGRERTYVMYDGQEVWSKMNPKLLTEVALAGGGAYIPAGTSQVDMAEVYDATVASVGRREFDTQSATRALPQFQWFAGAALAVLVAASLVRQVGGAPREATT
ncbi:MAG: VWA domain-containing protein [Phycisphaerales bacterium]